MGISEFNLRLTRRLRRLGIPVAYFIGPSVWAWRTYRVRQIARDVSRMLVILPFEAEFYARHGVRAVYVGNPLADGLRGIPAVLLNSKRFFAVSSGLSLEMKPESTAFETGASKR